MSSSQAAYPPRLQAILDDFRAYAYEDRMQLLIEYAEQFEPVPRQIAASPYPAENKVPACESDAYVFSTLRPDGTLDFYFAVENPQGVSAKALAAILAQSLSGEDLRQVGTTSEDVVYELFGSGISMGKGLGLMGMVQSVRAAAKRKLVA